MRTTIDLEAPVLEELKRVQQEEGISLGKLASRLLADALDFRRKKTAKPSKLSWNTETDAHLAVILRQHGVSGIHTADADVRKFDFLDVVNPVNG